MAMQSVDAALMAALEPLLPDCVAPNDYDGHALEYITTSYMTIPTLHAESDAAAARHLVMVRYFLPRGKNPNPMKLSISNALRSQGFTRPTITPAHDKEGQCWIFECEYVNAGAAYGYT